MVFKIPASTAHLKKNRFEFECDGEILSLPKIEFIPASADEFASGAVAQRLTQREFVIQFVGHCDPEVEKKLRAAGLDRGQVADFYKAWSAASKAALGESSASESS